MKVRMLDDGALRFTGPRGKVLESAAPLAGTTSELMRGNEREGHDITPATAVTRWYGKRIDYDLTIAGLLNQAVRGVSAEMSGRHHLRPPLPPASPSSRRAPEF